MEGIKQELFDAMSQVQNPDLETLLETTDLWS